MSVAWFVELERGPSRIPTKGSADGPCSTYTAARSNGRGAHHLVLPHRRRLRHPQPQRTTLRVPQKACRLGGHHPRSLPATARRRVGALFPARRPEVLQRPLPRGGRVSPFLVPSAGKEAP